MDWRGHCFQITEGVVGQDSGLTELWMGWWCRCGTIGSRAEKWELIYRLKVDWKLVLGRSREFETSFYKGSQRFGQL